MEASPKHHGDRLPLRQPQESELLARAIARAKEGDASALHFLYVRYADDVCGYVNSIVRDRHEAEDITQTLFAKLLTKIHRYEPREVPFSGWILRVARNATLDHMRARRLDPGRGGPHQRRGQRGPALRSLPVAQGGARAAARGPARGARAPARGRTDAQRDRAADAQDRERDPRAPPPWPRRAQDRAARARHRPGGPQARAGRQRLAALLVLSGDLRRRSTGVEIGEKEDDRVHEQLLERNPLVLGGALQLLPVACSRAPPAHAWSAPPAGVARNAARARRDDRSRSPAANGARLA